jgi:hypothetical protein
MTTQEQYNDYVQKRPWALALSSVVFFLLGLSMWFTEDTDNSYPYIPNGLADYVLGPLCMLMGIAGLLIALKRASD